MFPDKLNYTYCCSCNIRDPSTDEVATRIFQSWIDRIYVTDKLLDQARQWKIQPVGIARVDYDMVSVQIVHEEAPAIGKGCWACPDFILKDEKLALKIKELGIKTQEEIAEIKITGRSTMSNLQKAYYRFITEAMDMTKERECTIKCMAHKKESNPNKAISNLSRDLEMDELTHSKKLADLKKELRSIKQEEHLNTRCLIAAKDRLEGETVSKYYFQSNKESKPRDMMWAIVILEHTPPMPQANTPTENLNPRDDSEIPLMPQPKYEKLSPKMAEMMKEYHGKTLQNDGIDVDKEERETMITQTLSNLTNAPTEENKVKFTLKTK